MTRQGYRPLRYADDIILFASSPQDADRALRRARQVLEGECHLTLHPVKTQLVSIDEGFDFLGFRYFRDAKGRLHKVVRDKSVQGFRDAIRRRTRRHSGQRRPKAKHLTMNRLKRNQRLDKTIRSVNAYLRGWHWNFKHIHTPWKGYFRDFDAFVRRRLRACISGRHGNGWWKTRLTNKCLEELGLLSLEDLQAAYLEQRLSAPHIS